MTGFELVAGVIGIFFVTGIVMGVLIVAVLPAIWRRRAERERMLQHRPRYLSNDRDGGERPPPWPGSEPPFWPGNDGR